MVPAHVSIINTSLVRAKTHIACDLWNHFCFFVSQLSATIYQFLTMRLGKRKVSSKIANTTAAKI
jgi:hypothetical protein